MTVVNADKPSEYSRFFVREGETGSINLPAGHFDISWNIGHIWFNDEIGFGELGVQDSAGVMDFTRSDQGGWVQYGGWTLTLYPENYPLPDGL